MTSDGARAKAFSGRTLGYPVLSADSFAVVLDVNGTVLRAAVSNGPVAAAPHTVLGWRVEIWRAPGGAKVAC